MASREQCISAGFPDLESVPDFVYESLVLPEDWRHCADLIAQLKIDVNDMNLQWDIFKATGKESHEGWVHSFRSQMKTKRNTMLLYRTYMARVLRMTETGLDLNEHSAKINAAAIAHLKRKYDEAMEVGEKGKGWYVTQLIDLQKRRNTECNERRLEAQAKAKTVREERLLVQAKLELKENERKMKLLEMDLALSLKVDYLEKMLSTIAEAVAAPGEANYVKLAAVVEDLKTSRKAVENLWKTPETPSQQSFQECA